MSRQFAVILLAAVFLLTSIVVAWRWASDPSGKATGGATAAGQAILPPPEPGWATLYFPGRGGKLHPEQRALGEETEGEARIRLIVTELLRGPVSEELSPTLPAAVELSGLFLDIDGTLFLDFSSTEGSLGGIGSTAELLTVYSVVDTVLLNEPQAMRVVLMWNGRQHPSLAGHIDTTRPLTANRSLIAESS